ncbi:acetyltransferase [Vibrio paracholerae]|nr:acetyltransferase [Vibrio paracholerae]
MVSVVVVEFSVMRCQPLRRALYVLVNLGSYKGVRKKS